MFLSAMAARSSAPKGEGSVVSVDFQLAEKGRKPLAKAGEFLEAAERLVEPESREDDVRLLNGEVL